MLVYAPTLTSYTNEGSIKTSDVRYILVNGFQDYWEYVSRKIQDGSIKKCKCKNASLEFNSQSICLG